MAVVTFSHTQNSCYNDSDNERKAQDMLEAQLQREQLNSERALAAQKFLRDMGPLGYGGFPAHRSRWGG